MDFLISSNWVHSLLLMVMILLVLTGRRNGVFESRQRTNRERASLRAALIAEFQALRTVYRINLDLIAAGSPQLVTGRPYFSIYRGNMGKLLTLTPAEAAAVVTAHAASHTLESAVAIGMRMRARRADAAIWDAKGLDLWRLQRVARHTVGDALDLLEREAAAACAQRSLWQRMLAWLQGYFRPHAAAAPVPVPGTALAVVEAERP